ncbi:MAG: cytochrome c [Planctomycetes bacterium]|nr:cytochrome c [Planctomycetota bacterium]
MGIQPSNRSGRRQRAARRGSAALSGLFWLLALALFVAPFLRARDDIGSYANDFTRDTVADSETDKLDVPFADDVANYEREFGPGLAAHIAAASEHYFGLESPWLRDTGSVEFLRIPSGQQNFEIHCVGCHGAIGDGGGPAARYLKPRPRSFRKGLFKFTSTDAASRPQRRDLFQTITRGLAGSSMPEFRLVNEEKRWDLVEYVRWLAMKGEFEHMMLDDAWENEELPDAAELSAIVVARWHPANLRPIFPGVNETPNDAASVERGTRLFNAAAKGSCYSCHGERGKGDGPTALDYEDDWGYPIRPRDLSAGTFRAGAEGVDLYRTIAAGIKGTPMGSFEGALTPQEIWDLVHFIQSLSKQESPK